MVCQSPEGRGFKGKVVGLSVSQVPSEETDTDFQSPALGHNLTAAPSTLEAFSNKDTMKEVYV